MADYEIRYLKRDGSTALLYRPNCLGDADARRKATVAAGFASAEIWRGLECVEVIAFEYRA